MEELSELHKTIDQLSTQRVRISWAIESFPSCSSAPVEHHAALTRGLRNIYTQRAETIVHIALLSALMLRDDKANECGDEYVDVFLSDDNVALLKEYSCAKIFFAGKKRFLFEGFEEGYKGESPNNHLMRFVYVGTD